MAQEILSPRYTISIKFSVKLVCFNMLTVDNLHKQMGLFLYLLYVREVQALTVLPETSGRFKCAHE